MLSICRCEQHFFGLLGRNDDLVERSLHRAVTDHGHLVNNDVDFDEYHDDNDRTADRARHKSVERRRPDRQLRDTPRARHGQRVHRTLPQCLARPHSLASDGDHPPR